MNTRKMFLWSICLWYISQSTWALTPYRYNEADSAITAAINNFIIPGAVLCVVENGEISYLQAYGNRAIVPELEPMTTNTIFDLASLSKPLGAGTAMLLLCTEGKVKTEDFVSQYIPGYHTDVRISHLMTHYSGLPAYMNAVRLDSICKIRKIHHNNYPNFMIDTIATCQRPSTVGDKYRYSCLNFISLQRVVENIVKTDINSYLRNTHYQSLNLPTMGWLPDDSLLYRIAPTECTDYDSFSLCLRGQVHDPLAGIMMLGVSGNAGIFATAEEVAKWAIWFMNLSMESRKIGCNAGLWTDSVSTSMGTLTQSCRHTGYTGTSIAILPEYKRAVILLTNRVHPKDENSLGTLRKIINNALIP